MESTHAEQEAMYGHELIVLVVATPSCIIEIKMGDYPSELTTRNGCLPSLHTTVGS